MEVKSLDLFNTLWLTPQERYKKIVFYLLSTRFKVGKLKVIDEKGNVHFFGNDQLDTQHLSADITINDASFYKFIFLRKDIGFGESFELGHWKTNDLTALLKWFIDNYETSGLQSGSQDRVHLIGLSSFLFRLQHRLRKNTKSGSATNIRDHYDLSNDFFKLFLDPSMTYSSGIFAKEQSTLEDAQQLKYEMLCQDLDLQQNDRVLEVGCGWGGFAIYAAKSRGCRVHGITISKEQLSYAKERVDQEGLSDLITLELRDYRDLQGQYDKIVSIEMIEAVGDEYLNTYFEKLTSLLTAKGVLTIQAITSPDSRYAEFKKDVDWIQTYIFPGSLLPSISRMSQAVERCSNMHLINLRDIGLHYARTLKVWRESFLEKRETIEKMFDSNFVRRWEYYFSYCEAAFDTRNISNVQLTWIRPNNSGHKRGFF